MWDWGRDSMFQSKATAFSEKKATGFSATRVVENGNTHTQRTCLFNNTNCCVEDFHCFDFEKL